MLKTVIELYNKEKDLISKGMHVNQLKDDTAVDKVAKMKYIKESEIDRYFIETMKIVNTIGEEL
jgi:hypothetical protein